MFSDVAVKTKTEEWWIQGNVAKINTQAAYDDVKFHVKHISHTAAPFLSTHLYSF